jgi:hypothetical protein
MEKKVSVKFFTRETKNKIYYSQSDDPFKELKSHRMEMSPQSPEKNLLDI